MGRDARGALGPGSCSASCSEALSPIVGRLIFSRPQPWGLLCDHALLSAQAQVYPCRLCSGRAAIRAWGPAHPTLVGSGALGYRPTPHCRVAAICAPRPPGPGVSLVSPSGAAAHLLMLPPPASLHSDCLSRRSHPLVYSRSPCRYSGVNDATTTTFKVLRSWSYRRTSPEDLIITTR